MGFFDKIKKALKSTKDDVESQHPESSITKHDVFICHSIKDSEIALNICHFLEKNKFKCWIMPRNLTLDDTIFADEVVDAIKSTKIIVLVFSQSAQESKDVNNEISMAFSHNKPILSFNIDNSSPKGDMEYYLKETKWIYSHSGSVDEVTLIKEALKLCNGETSIVDKDLKQEFQSQNSEDCGVNDEIFHKSTPSDKIRNFKYLDTLIHSNRKEIVLDYDIILSHAEEFIYYKGIELDVNGLVINGNGHTIDAQGKTRIFYCTGKNIIIKNIILKNGFSEIGGAIYNNHGELSITESMLRGNTTKEAGFFYGRGGAIYNQKGKLTITSSTLIENTAHRSGGAITNREGELTITESTLNNNTAHRSGGAITNREGELTITESTLNNNTAHNNGGAIHNSSGELTITESTLQENTAQEGSGGAIYNYDGELTITESTLQENTAQEDGGAILNWGGVLSITESTIHENTAQEDGGAIENSSGELTITESTLNNNTAHNNGGAIHNKSGELTITESKIHENTAHRSGGVIYNTRGNFKIFNCEFLNNKSPNNIILNKDSLQIHKSIFKNNQSKFIVLNDGDGLNLGIFYGEFSENNVEESVLCNSGKFCSVERTLFENNISNNTMNNIINESELTLINPEIKDRGKSILNQNYIFIRRLPPKLENMIYGEGIVEIDEKIIPQRENFDFGYLDKKIHESETKEIVLDHDITFENYERDFYEGGIELDINNLIIDGNGHTINGSDKSRIFITTGKNIILKNIIFKNGRSHKNYDNPLNNNGGAIKIYNNSNLTIENCEFLNNTSGGEGGAIENSSGELTITESTLNNNTAQEDGGAIHNSSGELTITESTLNNNTAQEDGGAIHNSSGELTITESTLNNNTANWGGAILNKGGVLSITESTIHENTAHLSGGAIENSSGELTITESTLNNNTAQGTYKGTYTNYGGGAINNEGGELIITESTLNNNTAHNNGGAIHNKSGGKLNSKVGELTITESTLNNNTAHNNGGAIHNTSSALTITESTLNNNTADYGGAIQNNSEKLSRIENCKFNDNKPNDYE